MNGMSFVEREVVVMETAIIILLSLAILLFLLSFFRKDSTKKLEQELETLSLTHLQDMYQIKKRLGVLEDELLISQQRSPFQQKSRSHQLMQEVVALYEQEMSSEEIATATGLTSDEVERLLIPYLQAEKEGGQR
ncbi:hypothetical protein M3212_12785 [Alkalihalobacillus oceani]|uniref:hypothetical protein n=1 Tax=Halalkalibacter oceani TaxID=1653776 RepID=UPI00203E462E|nr:hypothetical protein [Halalkalibacter oceani]MCM3761664.1 hypothetical protein [Halalkalibacter oceani]